jgi:hypothetical protein
MCKSSFTADASSIAMEKKGRCEDLMEFALDPQNILSLMTAEKVRMLLVELDMIMEDYERELAIAYICSNYSSKKHMCTTILKGKHDHEIKEAVANVRVALVNDLEARKKKV